MDILTDDFLSNIIAQVRGYCPTLAGRVGGAAIFKEAISLAESANMAVPAGFIIPLDVAAERQSQNGTTHFIVEHFGVVAVLSNKVDERGQDSSNAMLGLQRELWRCLLGFQPSSDYWGCWYNGRTLLHLDRSRAFWQFEFATQHEIGPGDDWQSIDQNDPDKYPPLEIVHFGIDDIDPAADRNLVYPGPDGRIEFQFDVNPPQP